MNHKSKLPDQWGPSKAVPNKEAMAVWATCRNIVELNMNVQAICRKASAETMCIWRQIIKIKTSANQPQGTDNQQSLSTIEAINLAVAAINEFNETYQAFILHCINNFSCLSTCPRISIVSHVMFWNLGIFLLVDVFQSAIKDLDDSIALQTGPIIRKFQQDAVSCVAQAVERVLHLPAEEAFNLQNGFGAEVPITAYHVTPSLAVTALQKAIESVINLCLPWTNQSGLTPADGQVLIPDGIWDRQIDILMKGLMSLDVTIGGSQTSVLALRELMKKHGDIVSECWTSGFDT
ncbi:uncharacterized protein N7529_000228 [Penicillium soppii]|uniref:uncharacterized protein n=1 Tax=Penicillium soppii TaxID=69789 RepID=UPI0025491E34|nr:uncharacterized protein N7529_000228 [Penicillium soppii]KAJ5881556.1 hypothetical protein N7529_000228 [Penicillium soppii]